VVTVEHQTGSDRTAPAKRPPARADAGTGIRGAHLTVCKARCAQRAARAGDGRTPLTGGARPAPGAPPPPLRTDR
jgi:hypothetical protein